MSAPAKEKGPAAKLRAVRALQAAKAALDVRIAAGAPETEIAAARLDVLAAWGEFKGDE